MGLLDDVMVNVKSAANSVGKKTNEIVDYSKLRFTASGLNNEIRKKYQTLGEEVYTSTKIGSEDTKSIELLIREIDELKAQLQSTKEQITYAKNKIICPVCKAELNKIVYSVTNVAQRLSLNHLFLMKTQQKKRLL